MCEFHLRPPKNFSTIDVPIRYRILNSKDPTIMDGGNGNYALLTIIFILIFKKCTNFQYKISIL